DPRDVLPQASEAPSRLDVLRAKLANVRADVAAIKSDLKGGYSKALADVLREKETEEESVATAFLEEKAKTARPVDQAWQHLPSLVDLIDSAGNEARLKLRPVLHRVVESMHVLTVRRGVTMIGAVQVFFPGGKRRDYLIVYTPAGNGREGGWSCCS